MTLKAVPKSLAAFTSSIPSLSLNAKTVLYFGAAGAVGAIAEKIFIRMRPQSKFLSRAVIQCIPITIAQIATGTAKRKSCSTFCIELLGLFLGALMGNMLTSQFPKRSNPPNHPAIVKSVSVIAVS